MDVVKLSRIEKNNKYWQDKNVIKPIKYYKYKKHDLNGLSRKDWKKAYEQLPERIIKRKEEYSTMRGRLVHWKRGAKIRGIEWTLTIDDLNKMTQTCFYSGDQLTFTTNLPNTISLEAGDIYEQA